MKNEPWKLHEDSGTPIYWVRHGVQDCRFGETSVCTHVLMHHNQAGSETAAPVPIRGVRGCPQLSVFWQIKLLPVLPTG